MKPRAYAILLAFLASACTTIDPGAPVAGWPELKIFEHHVPHAQMRERCMKYTPPMMSPEACAEFYFVEGECHIWFSADFPPPAHIVEHERQHCQGYEHAGETALSEILARYTASTQSAQASASQGSTTPPAPVPAAASN
jgi:hypothetical protein